MEKVNSSQITIKEEADVESTPVQDNAVDDTIKRKRSDEMTTSESADPLPKKRRLLWDKTKTKTSKSWKQHPNPNIAKSRHMQRTMSIHKLLKLEEAIKEWNAHFGTDYTLLL